MCPGRHMTTPHRRALRIGAGAGNPWGGLDVYNRGCAAAIDGRRRIAYNAGDSLAPTSMET